MSRREASAASSLVKRLAHDAGFELVGIAPANALDATYLKAWLDAGHHGSLEWMRKSASVRTDPRALLPSARSVISLGLNYYHPGSTERPGGGRLSRYAWGRDYHKVMRSKLRRLRRAIESELPQAELWGGSDAVPIAEKVWAAQAGLGWVGKNGNLISQRYGSWIFLATLITNLELQEDTPHPNRCGRCSDCLPACPTGALLGAGVVDARRCLAYHSIEHQDRWPEAIADHAEGWIFGCDACQDCCPWNLRFAVQSCVAALGPREDLEALSLRALLRLDEAAFETLSRGSPLRRAKREGFLRSVIIACELEAPNAALDEALAALLGDASELLRFYAERTLSRREHSTPGTAPSEAPIS